MWFKQEGAITNLIVKPLKLVDLFIHLGSNISSTEMSSMYLERRRWLQLIGFQSFRNLIPLIKLNGISSKLCLCKYNYIDVPPGPTKTQREKGRWELHKNATCCIEAEVWPLTSHLRNHANVT